ncbi:hypothetical protein [Planctobacterium marinum]|uniref:hypothetical protein n=1 Tax=Planctobacterium marinum TaxID=1631968 RepID=UPI001E389158|nr:hypothetical protein [Planctobacterium marinum]MCC2606233.1 hypothetical protein [Planctobacterium marinum]
MFLCLALLLAIVQRLLLLRLYRSWFKRGFVGDSSVHISIFEAVKKQFYAKKVARYLIPGPMHYPLGFHRFFLFLKPSFVRKIPYFPNLILFLIAVTWMFFTQEVLQFSIDPSNNPSSNSAAWVALTLFLISPINTIFTGPNIAYLKFSERYFGLLLCSASYLFQFLYVSNIGEDKTGGLQSLNLWWSFSVLFGAMAFSSSIFARQVVVIFDIVLFCLLQEMFFVYHLAISIFLPVLWEGKYHLRSVYLQVEYLKRYWQKVRHSKTHKMSLVQFSKSKILKLNGEPLRTVLLNFHYFFSLGLILVYDVDIIWVVFFTVPFLCYFFISFPQLSFIGESYRYIEYPTYLLSFYVIVDWLLQQPDWGFFWGYFLTSFIIFLIFTRMKKVVGFTTIDEMIVACKIDEKSVVFPVTMRLGADLNARTGCKTFWWQPGGLADESLWDKYIYQYPYLNRDLTRNVSAYGLTHIVCDKKALSSHADYYDFSEFELVYEDFYFVVYRA